MSGAFSISGRDALRYFFRTLLIPVLFVALPACSDDPEKPEQKPPPSPYRDMSSPDNVIFNLEVTYNKRDGAKYATLLDPVNYIFFFADQDINNPDLDISGPLTYDEDAHYTRNMFDPNFVSTKGQLPIQNITMNLSNDALTWVEYQDPTSGETWQKTTVFYYFVIDTAQDSYSPGNDALAEFICREADYNNGTEWRLVRWRDVGSPAVASSASRTTGVKTTTVGALKSLYK